MRSTASALEPKLPPPRRLKIASVAPTDSNKYQTRSSDCMSMRSKKLGPPRVIHGIIPAAKA